MPVRRGPRHARRLPAPAHRRHPPRPERAGFRPDIGHLFALLNQKGDHNRRGVYAGTRYVNGDLFARPAAVLPDRSELDHLRRAAGFDWRAVDPTVFGSLLEGVLGQQRRWELGAHYTHEVDILKIVVPTIVRPWRERIAATTTPQQARDLLDGLCAFRVLNPACGCGSFLYVAYHELQALDAETKARIRDLAAQTGLPVPRGPWPYYPWPTSTASTSSGSPCSSAASPCGWGTGR